jgi:small subunit ribosomal protein S20
VRNKSVRSAVKTSLIKAEKLISEKEAEAISAEMIQVSSILDRAAKKGVIHPSSSGQRKARSSSFASGRPSIERSAAD